MSFNIRAETNGNAVRVFLPGDIIRDLPSLRDLQRTLDPYLVLGGKYAAFKAELLRTGKASTDVHHQKGWQV
ncbi:MAG: hypothetical protein WAN23_15495 [Candidatus Acidiferrales bacterium]